MVAFPQCPQLPQMHSPWREEAAAAALASPPAAAATPGAGRAAAAQANPIVIRTVIRSFAASIRVGRFKQMRTMEAARFQMAAPIKLLARASSAWVSPKPRRRATAAAKFRTADRAWCPGRLSAPDQRMVRAAILSKLLHKYLYCSVLQAAAAALASVPTPPSFGDATHTPKAAKWEKAADVKT